MTSKRSSTLMSRNHVSSSWWSRAIHAEAGRALLDDERAMTFTPASRRERGREPFRGR
ncbi:hypothetical protein AKJ09_02853 [Labilithrix luteola]|uniref:Uncharacterized protein n=1 Tax=Labilithrix luteola TaxID=1391654 RepID=A0A0K1PST8_9BACT|nr:hypothetical protein AKJ09_02853 [Labilithrix luteola]